MEASWSNALWRQFGAAIDMLEEAIAACPASLWTERVWNTPVPPYFPAQFSEFWFISFHTVVWLDQYLAGVPEEEFSPPARFAQGEIDSHDSLPERPYTQDEVLAYLSATREKCRITLGGLTNEQALRPIEYGWTQGQLTSYLELQLYNMRHVQEHAAQLSLFLGQHIIEKTDRDWVARAKGDPDGR